MRERKIVLFGAGGEGEYVCRRMKQNPSLFDETCVAFSDNDERKWGKTLYDVTILRPSELTNEYADCFVICSKFAESIRKQLTEDLGIDDDKILVFQDYERKLYCEEKYYRKYGIKGHRSDNLFNVDNLLIYTAIIGDYDELHEPEFVDKNITYECVTDNPNLKSDVWNIRYVNNDERDNVRMARKIKINPHLFFPEYETSVWVDGKFQITGDIREYIWQFGGDSPMLCFPHFDRNCVYDEGGKCIFLGYGDKKEIIKQLSDYYGEGYPFDNGLYETGCIVRRHNDVTLKGIMKEWMDEVRKYSYRDQLSLPVVCKRNSFSPDISFVNCFNNRWLQFHEHKKWHGRI